MLRLVPSLTNNLCKLIPAYFSTMRRVGKHYVPDLPAYRVNPQALRQIVKDQPQMSINQYYDLTGQYKKYRDLPQCRYFAFEYKNTIYHVFNAYFYPMGRMINQIGTIIRGRNTPHYKNNQVNLKNGEICVIVNAEDPLFTGKKLLYKNFKYHTGFVGNLKTFSYRSVLNKKPELLYYYLLRKAMPKTKISQKYLQNVKIFRGPTHDIPNIPQFAPMKFIQNPITQMDFKGKFQSQEGQTLFKAHEGPKGSVRGQILQGQMNRQEPTLQQKQSQSNFSYERKTKLKNKYSQDKTLSFLNIQKKIRRRYRTVRAPYVKKPQYDPGYRMFYSEKEAAKSEFYQQIANQELPQGDEQIVEDPLKRKGFDK